MVRLMLLWDEIDDLVWFVRHALGAFLGGARNPALAATADLKNR